MEYYPIYRLFDYDDLMLIILPSYLVNIVENNESLLNSNDITWIPFLEEEE